MPPTPDQPDNPGLPLSGEVLRAVESAPAALRPWAALAAARAYGMASPPATVLTVLPAPAPEADSAEPPEPFDRNNREQIIKDYVPLVKFVAHRIA